MGFFSFTRNSAVALHEVASGRPVRVAVEQRAADPAVQHAVEGLVVLLGGPGARALVALGEALDPQSLLVGRAAAEAAVPRGVAILAPIFEALHQQVWQECQKFIDKDKARTDPFELGKFRVDVQLTFQKLSSIDPKLEKKCHEEALKIIGDVSMAHQPGDIQPFRFELIDNGVDDFGMRPLNFLFAALMTLEVFLDG